MTEEDEEIMAQETERLVESQSFQIPENYQKLIYTKDIASKKKTQLL